MLLFALVAHEVAHGWTALRQGDDTAYRQGRITLNPVSHVDPWLTILLPALLWFGSGGRFTFGGARPIPVQTAKFRHYVRGDLIVSSAGVVTNLILAVLCTAAFIAIGAIHNAAGQLGTSTVDVAQRMLNWGIHLNLVLAVFNLIPVPPLDGSRLFFHVLPPKAGAAYRSIDRFGFLPMLALLILFRPVLDWFMAPASWLYLRCLELAVPFAVGDGWNIFQR